MNDWTHRSTISSRVRDPKEPFLMPRAARWIRLLGVRVAPDDPRVAALSAATDQGDPLADAVVEEWAGSDGAALRQQLEVALRRGLPAVADPSPALRALFAALDHVPVWVDRDRMALGARAMRRHGRDGLIALAAASLMTGYLSAPATKPIAFTGALEKATPHRLAATSKLTHCVATTDMSRFSEGFAVCVRVRLMHAMVRRGLAASPRWRAEEWGVPINQRDMLATHLQFSVTYLAGVFALGRLDTREERDGLMRLWRYVSYLVGVRDDLLPCSMREGLEVASILNATEPGPDADGRTLARALVASFDSPAGGVRTRIVSRLVSRFVAGYARFYMGDSAADRLGLPGGGWKYVPPVLFAVRLPGEVLGLVSRRVRERQVRAGKRVLVQQQQFALGGRTPSFAPYEISAA